MQIELPTEIDEASAAAIVAALELLLATEQAAAPAAGPTVSAWAVAGCQENQGMLATRRPITWANADRIRER
jgi:hypothetical protein